MSSQSVTSRRAKAGRPQRRRGARAVRAPEGLLVDPVSGREGPGEIVVTDGILESVVWLEGEEAKGVDDKGVIVAPGFFDLHAHFREPGFEDAETVATGSAAAAHGGYTTVALMPNTSPTLDEPACWSAFGRPPAPADRPSRFWRSVPSRPGRAGEQLSAMGELARRRRYRLLGRRRAGSIAQAPAQRAALRRNARPARLSTTPRTSS